MAFNNGFNLDVSTPAEPSDEDFRRTLKNTDSFIRDNDNYLAFKQAVLPPPFPVNGGNNYVVINNGGMPPQPASPQGFPAQVCQPAYPHGGQGHPGYPMHGSSSAGYHQPMGAMSLPSYQGMGMPASLTPPREVMAPPSTSPIGRQGHPMVYSGMGHPQQQVRGGMSADMAAMGVQYTPLPHGGMLPLSRSSRCDTFSHPNMGTQGGQRSGNSMVGPPPRQVQVGGGMSAYMGMMGVRRTPLPNSGMQPPPSGPHGGGFSHPYMGFQGDQRSGDRMVRPPPPQGQVFDLTSAPSAPQFGDMAGSSIVANALQQGSLDNGDSPFGGPPGFEPFNHQVPSLSPHAFLQPDLHSFGQPGQPDWRPAYQSGNQHQPIEINDDDHIPPFPSPQPGQGNQRSIYTSNGGIPSSGESGPKRKRGADTAVQTNPDGTPMEPPPKRGRGRPKGSRNKKGRKGGIPSSDEASGNGSSGNGSSSDKSHPDGSAFMSAIITVFTPPSPAEPRPEKYKGDRIGLLGTFHRTYIRKSPNAYLGDAPSNLGLYERSKQTRGEFLKMERDKKAQKKRAEKAKEAVYGKKYEARKDMGIDKSAWRKGTDPTATAGSLARAKITPVSTLPAANTGAAPVPPPAPHDGFTYKENRATRLALPGMLPLTPPPSQTPSPLALTTLAPAPTAPPKDKQATYSIDELLDMLPADPSLAAGDVNKHIGEFADMGAITEAASPAIETTVTSLGNDDGNLCGDGAHMVLLGDAEPPPTSSEQPEAEEEEEDCMGAELTAEFAVYNDAKDENNRTAAKSAAAFASEDTVDFVELFGVDTDAPLALPEQPEVVAKDPLVGTIDGLLPSVVEPKIVAETSLIGHQDVLPAPVVEPEADARDDDLGGLMDVDDIMAETDVLDESADASGKSNIESGISKEE